MIPTKQTILHDPANGVHGNCFSAVLASLLHVDISTVPVFTDPKSWQRQVNDWLRPFGVAFMQLSGVPDACGELAIMGMHHEKCGNTQRSNEVLHSVVAVDGEAIFDPHPDASGLVNEVNCGVFLSLEPWRVATLERELSEAKEREARLRQLLFLRVAGASGYSDDGELQDSTTFPVIDFKRDSVQSIEDKLIERGVANFVKTFGAALQEQNNG